MLYASVSTDSELFCSAHSQFMVCDTFHPKPGPYTIHTIHSMYHEVSPPKAPGKMLKMDNKVKSQFI